MSLLLFSKSYPPSLVTCTLLFTHTYTQVVGDIAGRIDMAVSVKKMLNVIEFARQVLACGRGAGTSLLSMHPFFGGLALSSDAK